MTETAAQKHSSSAPSNGSPILEVKNLVKHFPITSGLLRRQVGSVKAVDDVSFHLEDKETLGIVGESGCGKTTLGRSIIRLIEPTDGQVLFRGEDVTAASSKRMRELRKDMQIVFQDPFASLNPRMPINDIVAEPLRVHGWSKKAARERVAELLDAVGLSPEHENRYPHEFSGGQRQRIGIARAIALSPSFIVLDEPVSALDVSVQAQVLNLLEDLQEDLDLSLIFIAHDLSVVRHISDRVMVMYLGQMAELADRNDVYDNPSHPYTCALLSAVPIPDPDTERTRERIILPGDLPSPSNPPPGCRFHTRCPLAVDRCRQEIPEVREITPGHWVACHFALSPGEEILDRIEAMGREVELLGVDSRSEPGHSEGETAG
jgi:oligopeptide/dipeptide ABC transporter ATP-binding protein